LRADHGPVRCAAASILYDFPDSGNHEMMNSVPSI
jgi:hypothetical protein